MNKQELVEVVAKECEVSKACGEKAINAILDGIKSGVKKTKEVRLIGFGTFSVRTKKAGFKACFFVCVSFLSGISNHYVFSEDVSTGSRVCCLRVTLRSFSVRSFFLNRKVFGVISTNSSSSIYSRAISSEYSLGGGSFIPLSAVAQRILVAFLALMTFTEISFCSQCSPTIIPSYTRSPGFTNMTPLSSNHPRHKRLFWREP